jgi:tRNA(Ser,Leu) C12 N-acetylase TAN1
MSDWNVVVSLKERGYKKAFRDLQGFGLVENTGFFNVLGLKVNQIDRFLEVFSTWLSSHPNLLTSISRIVPVTHTFVFQSPEEFEAKAKEITLQWVGILAGKKFHVRMHRRGFKGRLSSLEEEHFLDGVLLNALSTAGTPGQITFENPEAIIIVETIGQWAGLACWTREELERYPWMGLD